MRKLRVTAAALIVAVAVSAHAGLTYRFTAGNGSGRIWVDGDRRRLELDPDPVNPRAFDVSITRDGKTTFINLQNETYFGEPRPANDAKNTSASSLQLRLPPIVSRESIKGRPSISHQNAGAGDAIGGYATTKHVVRLRYTIEGELQGNRLRANVVATLSLLVADSLHEFAERDRHLHTGFSGIDGELDRIFDSIRGLIVASEVSISRQFEGGQPFTERTTMKIDELKVVDVDEGLFRVPPGLRHQEPVFGAPGQ